MVRSYSLRGLASVAIVLSATAAIVPIAPGKPSYRALQTTGFCTSVSSSIIVGSIPFQIEPSSSGVENPSGTYTVSDSASLKATAGSQTYGGDGYYAYFPNDGYYQISFDVISIIPGQTVYVALLATEGTGQVSATAAVTLTTTSQKYFAVLAVDTSILNSITTNGYGLVFTGTGQAVVSNIMIQPCLSAPTTIEATPATFTQALVQGSTAIDGATLTASYNGPGTDTTIVLATPGTYLLDLTLSITNGATVTIEAPPSASLMDIGRAANVSSAFTIIVNASLTNLVRLGPGGTIRISNVRVVAALSATQGILSDGGEVNIDSAALINFRGQLPGAIIYAIGRSIVVIRNSVFTPGATQSLRALQTLQCSRATIFVENSTITFDGSSSFTEVSGSCDLAGVSSNLAAINPICVLPSAVDPTFNCTSCSFGYLLPYGPGCAVNRPCQPDEVQTSSGTCFKKLQVNISASKEYVTSGEQFEVTTTVFNRNAFLVKFVKAEVKVPARFVRIVAANPIPSYVRKTGKKTYLAAVYLNVSLNALETRSFVLTLRLTPFHPHHEHQPDNKHHGQGYKHSAKKGDKNSTTRVLWGPEKKQRLVFIAVASYTAGPNGKDGFGRVRATTSIYAER